jgi:hypothetical protein
MNQELVKRSLSNADEITLPLSSEYDFCCVLANDPELAKRTRCFTYGSEGSIEVEGGVD